MDQPCKGLHASGDSNGGFRSSPAVGGSGSAPALRVGTFAVMTSEHDRLRDESNSASTGTAPTVRARVAR